MIPVGTAIATAAIAAPARATATAQCRVVHPAGIPSSSCQHGRLLGTISGARSVTVGVTGPIVGWAWLHAGRAARPGSGSSTFG